MTTTTPLDDVDAGQRVRISQIHGGRDLTARLYAMGLTPGASVDVIATGGGPMILDVLGSRLMLGRGMAAKVLVRVVGKAPDK